LCVNDLLSLSSLLKREDPQRRRNEGERKSFEYTMVGWCGMARSVCCENIEKETVISICDCLRMYEIHVCVNNSWAISGKRRWEECLASVVFCFLVYNWREARRQKSLKVHDTLVFHRFILCKLQPSLDDENRGESGWNVRRFPPFSLFSTTVSCHPNSRVYYHLQKEEWCMRTWLGVFCKLTRERVHSLGHGRVSKCNKSKMRGHVSDSRKRPIVLSVIGLWCEVISWFKCFEHW